MLRDMHFSTSFWIRIKIENVHVHQWRITLAIIKKFVMMYNNTIRVRIVATLSANLSFGCAFSPSDFAHSVHQYLRYSLSLYLIYNVSFFFEVLNIHFEKWIQYCSRNHWCCQYHFLNIFRPSTLHFGKSPFIQEISP